MAFLPTGYKIPDTGGRYFKPKKGENKVRILTEPIIGYEAWDKRGEKAKPIRADKDDKEGIEELHRISALQENDDDKRVKHFWAMVIYNYDESAIQIWEIPQATIQEALVNLSEDGDWGDPRGYGIKINKTGDGKDTKYAVLPSPKSKLPAALVAKQSETPVNLQALFAGEDPFELEASPAPATVSADDGPDEEEVDDIPF